MTPLDPDDPIPETSDLAEASQWSQGDQSTGLDRDRSFALLVALWALALPAFIAVLLFVGMLTIESDHNGLWVLIGGIVALLLFTAYFFWNDRRSKQHDISS